MCRGPNIKLPHPSPPLPELRQSFWSRPSVTSWPINRLNRVRCQSSRKVMKRPCTSAYSLSHCQRPDSTKTTSRGLIGLPWAEQCKSTTAGHIYGVVWASFHFWGFFDLFYFLCGAFPFWTSFSETAVGFSQFIRIARFRVSQPYGCHIFRALIGSGLIFGHFLEKPRASVPIGKPCRGYTRTLTCTAGCS